MVTPDQLRILANEWRNIAHVGRNLHHQQLELDLSGGSVNGLLSVENAVAQATALDERADHLEATLQRRAH